MRADRVCAAYTRGLVCHSHMERVIVLLTILTAKKSFAAVESVLRERGTRVLSRNSDMSQIVRADRVCAAYTRGLVCHSHMERVIVLLTILTAKKRFAAVESVLRECGTRVLSRNSDMSQIVRADRVCAAYTRGLVCHSHMERVNVLQAILTAQKTTWR